MQPYTQARRRIWCPILAAASLMLTSPSDGTAQALPPAAKAPLNLSTVGPQIGQQVPEFRLMDQNGRAWTRDSIAGPKGAMLVFFRSADW